MGNAKGSSPPTPRALSPKTARQREVTTKRRGELAELAFVFKAASLGFGVAKPYGDSERYDFILDSRALDSSALDFPTNDVSGKLWRVQVKSTTTLLNGLYRINAHRRVQGRAIAYRPSEVDFLVAHIIPEDAWFVLPIEDILDRTSLLFSPKSYARPSHHDEYREAWHLFRQPEHS
jgi:hypothetical protein